MAKDVLEIKKAERESNTKKARPNLLAGRLFIFLGLHNCRCIFLMLFRSLMCPRF